MQKEKKENLLARIERIVLPVTNELGLDLVDVEYLQDGGYWYLKFMWKRKMTRSALMTVLK